MMNTTQTGAGRPRNFSREGLALMRELSILAGTPQAELFDTIIEPLLKMARRIHAPDDAKQPYKRTLAKIEAIINAAQKVDA